MSQYQKPKNSSPSTHITSGNKPKYFIPEGLDSAVRKTYSNVLTELIAAADSLEEQLRSFYSKKPTYDWLSSGSDVLHGDAIGIVPIAALKNQDSYVMADHVTTQMNNYSSSSYELVDALLHSPHKGDDDGGLLMISYSPKNEVDRLVSMTYHRTTLSNDQIVRRVDSASYDQKVQLLQKSYDDLTQFDEHIVSELGSYQFDCLTEYHVLDMLCQRGVCSSLQTQAISPYYGYAVPKLVEQANLGDVYQDSFDKSMKLYQLLWDGGYHAESQSALLCGHIVRWRMSIRLDAVSRLFELDKNQSLGAESAIISDIISNIEEAHSLLAQSLRGSTK